MPSPVTWKMLAAYEPRLAAMLEEAKKIDGSDARFCANEVWFMGGMKDRVIALAGWEAPVTAPAWMRGQSAYDVAYQTIYDALPPCRDCFCM